MTSSCAPNTLHNKTFSFVFVCLEVLVDTALAARRFGPSCPDNYPCPSNLAYMGNTTNLPGKPYPLCGADVEDCTAYWTCASADGTYTGVPRRYSNVVSFHIIIV